MVKFPFSLFPDAWIFNATFKKLYSETIEGTTLARSSKLFRELKGG
jgi:hypothetical protein